MTTKQEIKKELHELFDSFGVAIIQHGSYTQELACSFSTRIDKIIDGYDDDNRQM